MTKQIFLRDEIMVSDTIGRMRFILLFGVLMIHSRLAIDNIVDFSNFNTTELYKLCMYTGSLVIPSFCVPTFFLISWYLFFTSWIPSNSACIGTNSRRDLSRCLFHTFYSVS